MLLRRLIEFFVQAWLYTRFLAYLLHVGVNRGYAEPSWDWMLSYLALSFPLAIFIHECGHYLAGIALGWRFTRFAIGPFQLALTHGRLRAELITVRHYGLVGFAPSNYSCFRMQRAFLSLAGPLASFAGGAVFIYLSLRAPSAQYFWICMCNAQWAILGIMQMIPFSLGRGGSDGFHVMQAIVGGPSMDAVQAGMLTNSSHLTTLRLRDWPRDLILRLVDTNATKATKAGADANARFRSKDRRYYYYLAYLHFLDAGEIELAGGYLDQLMARWTPADPPEFALEAAYFRAFHRNSPESARNWLTLEKRSPEPWVRLRAEAAISHSQPLIDQALASLRTAPPCGANQYEIDRLEELRSVARQIEAGAANFS